MVNLDHQNILKILKIVFKYYMKDRLPDYINDSVNELHETTSLLISLNEKQDDI